MAVALALAFIKYRTFASSEVNGIKEVNTPFGRLRS